MRMYTVAFEAQTYTNAGGDFDLFEITPASNKPCAIFGLVLSNVGVAADAGDVQEELLRLSIVRGFTASGSGGATPTPALVSPNDTAAGFTADTMNGTVATTGTGVVLYADGWNIRIPYLQWFPPEVKLEVSSANTTLVVRAASTVTDDVTISGTLFVAEMI